MVVGEGESQAPVFSLGPSGARARSALALAGLLAALGSRFLTPRLASAATEDPLAFYLLAALVDAVLAAPSLLLLGRIGRARLGVRALYGLLGGVAAYLALLGVAGFLGVLGSSTGGLLGRLVFASYTMAYSLAVVSGLYSIALSASPHDDSLGSAVGGVVYALLVAGPMALAGRDPVVVLGVAASTMAVGGAAVAVAYEAGVWGGVFFLGTLQALALAGPWSLGGSVLVASAVLAIASAVGWAMTLMVASGAPEGISPPRLTRRMLASIAVVAFLAASAAYLYSQDIVFWRPYVIVTGSMEPALDRGDLVILERVDPSQLRVGDIITYMKGRTPVTHRIVAVTGEGFITKGDANLFEDPYIVEPDQVVGRVWAVIPKLGWIAIILNWNPIVRLATVVAASAVIAYIALKGGGEIKPSEKEEDSGG